MSIFELTVTLVSMFAVFVIVYSSVCKGCMSRIIRAIDNDGYFKHQLKPHADMNHCRNLMKSEIILEWFARFGGSLVLSLVVCYLYGYIVSMILWVALVYYVCYTISKLHEEMASDYAQLMKDSIYNA